MFRELNLSGGARSYFLELFNSINFASLLYEGKWEKTFTGVPKLLRRIVGTRYDEIFRFTDLKEQNAYFDRELNHQAWLIVPRLVLRAFGNAAFFNAFLYKGSFVKKNLSETHFEIYRNAFRKLFYQDLTRSNFFLQLIFLGHLYYTEGNPIEAHQEIFSAVKESLKEKKVTLKQSDLLKIAAEDTQKFDFVSLSDVPSYFSGEVEVNYLQTLAQGLNEGALVVVRCYLRVPEGTVLDGYDDVTAQYQDLVKAEKTQIYTTFIYRYRGQR